MKKTYTAVRKVKWDILHHALFTNAAGEQVYDRVEASAAQRIAKRLGKPIQREERPLALQTVKAVTRVELSSKGWLPQRLYDELSDVVCQQELGTELSVGTLEAFEELVSGGPVADDLRKLIAVMEANSIDFILWGQQ